jgi:hypothetical protein
MMAERGCALSRAVIESQADADAVVAFIEEHLRCETGACLPPILTVVR